MQTRQVSFNQSSLWAFVWRVVSCCALIRSALLVSHQIEAQYSNPSQDLRASIFRLGAKDQQSS